MSFKYIIAAQALDVPLAKTLAEQLDLTFLDSPPQTGVYLAVNQSRFFLRGVSKNHLNWAIDFESLEYTAHLQKRTRKKDPLSRALNLHQKPASRILDMSAGLGKDALWVAHCGAHVTLLERDPVLAFLLNHAIQQLALSNPALASRMQCHCICAEDYLKTLAPETFDAAYYDPMFVKPHRSAQVKKDMQILRMAFHDTPPSFIPINHRLIPRWVIKRYKNDPVYTQDLKFETGMGVVRYEVY